MAEGTELILSATTTPSKDERKLIDLGVDVMALKTSSKLSLEQQFVLSMPTPTHHIKNRVGKGGSDWKYLPISRVIERLNLAFGCAWSFTVNSKEKAGDEVIVEGSLIVNLDGDKVVKTDFGVHEVQYKNVPKLDENGKPIPKKAGSDEVIMVKSDIPLSLGNDYKSASSDCLKRCAAQFGIGLDVRESTGTMRAEKIAVLQQYIDSQKELQAEQHKKLNTLKNAS